MVLVTHTSRSRYVVAAVSSATVLLAASELWPLPFLLLAFAFVYYISPSSPIILKKQKRNRRNSGYDAEKKGAGSPGAPDPDLKRREERFRAFVEQSSEGIWCFEVDRPIPITLPVEDQIRLIYERGYLTECNSVMAQMYGFSDREEFLGIWVRELLPQTDPGNQQYLRLFVESGYRIVDGETHEIDRHGNTLHFLNNLVGIVEDGCLLRAWGTQRDITERRRAEMIQAAIYQISEATNKAEDLNDLFRLIHKIVGELMPAKNFYIALWEDSGLLSFPYWVDEQDEAPAPRKLSKGVTEYVLRTGVAFKGSPETFAELHKSGEAELIGSQSIDWFGVPLKTKGKTIGALVVQSYTERIRFGEEVRNILDFVSSQIAMAIERKRAEDGIKRSREQLRALAAHLQSVREEERARIAREIHDELGQSLTALKMEFAWLARKLPRSGKPLVDKIESMSTLIDVTVQSVRKISTTLRPAVLDNLGLVAAIEWQAQEFESHTGITVEMLLPSQDISLDGDRSTAIFRIFQEVLTNVARHAEATGVEVTLKKAADHLSLEIKDNGRGITEREISSSNSFGLLGIRERVLLLGGEVEIIGSHGQGTTVTARIPLSAGTRH